MTATNGPLSPELTETSRRLAKPTGYIGTPLEIRYITGVGEEVIAGAHSPPQKGELVELGLAIYLVQLVTHHPGYHGPQRITVDLSRVDTKPLAD